jgi:pantoate--beta-alanine ligase
MGALHQGHISLIENVKKHTTLTISSIFINPTQFNDLRDFKKYPSTLEKDIYLLESAGADALFLPEVMELYPSGTSSLEHYRLGKLENILEGKFRPGHFQGVCQVMNRLLQIVKPHVLCMGQKDYQQCLVVKRLIHDHSYEIRFITVPTVRESDGLAMSSRNLRLNQDERIKAALINQTLEGIRKNMKKGDLTTIKAAARTNLEQNGFKIDYVEIADSVTLEPVDFWNGSQQLIALVAVFLNEVRLIDNMMME